MVYAACLVYAASEHHFGFTSFLKNPKLTSIVCNQAGPPVCSRLYCKEIFKISGRLACYATSVQQLHFFILHGCNVKEGERGRLKKKVGRLLWSTINYTTQVLQTFHSYLELRRCCPRLRKLLELLRQSPYKGVELEHLSSTDDVCPKVTAFLVFAAAASLCSPLHQLL